MSSITLTFPATPPPIKPAEGTKKPAVKCWPRTGLLIAATCCGVIVLSVARFSLVRGWVRPIRIEGGSMAETLCGDHLTTACRDCGDRVRCDIASIPGDGELLCPNCGFPGNSEREASAVLGERVLVDAFPAAVGGLRRWDLVAVSHFGKGKGPAAKRLVALPGESWEIRNGDLWINGRVERKSLDQLREMMVTVNEDVFRPRSQQGSSRWKPAQAKSGWQDQRGQFHYAPNDADKNSAEDWLVYHHQRGLGATPGSDRATTVKDLDAYNQAESRTLFPVHDLGASFQLEATDAQVIDLAVTGQAGRIRCSLEVAERKILVRSGETILAEQRLPWHDWRRATFVEFGVCDEQMLLGINGREVLRVDLDVGPIEPTAAPLAIRLVGKQATVSELRVWRDLHYLDPHGRSADWRPSRPLGDNEMAILGDNPPVSIDSRHMALPVRRDDIWGHVRRPFRY